MKKHENIITKEEKAAIKLRDNFGTKFPWAFALAGGFGVVATFYGFEKLIDKVDLFTNNPWILLLTGIITLAITGSFYNKLK